MGRRDHTLNRIAVLLLASGLLAVLANSLHPRKIPWVQDWSGQVEARAKQQGIGVVSFSVALATFQGNSATFVDARPPGDFAKGHIPGARSIPFQSMDEQFPAIVELAGSGRELVFYCSNRTCDDALLLAAEFQALGASNLLLFVDGFDTWRKRGAPLEAAE